MSDDRSCTCHPDEAPVPCQKRYAFSECQLSALRAELAAEREHNENCIEEIRRFGWQVAKLREALDKAACSLRLAGDDETADELLAVLKEIRDA